jgi:multidrug efflux pump subunit AcrA (membrane-fusion protein)
VAVVLLGGAGVAIWRLESAGSAATLSTERTVAVTRQTIKDTVGATGTVQPKYQSAISFTSSGTVTSVKVDVGTRVHKGQKLATIDDTDLQADLTAAKADYEAAQSDLTTAEDASDVTTAELDAAKSKVAVDKSKVAQAKTALAAATLRSPISGTVALVNIAKGDSVGSGSAASGSGSSGSGGTGSSGTGSGGTGSGGTGSGGTGSGNSGASGSGSSTSSSADITVISTGTFRVETSVASADVAKVKKGLQATVSVSGSTQPIFGTVSSVAVMATSSSAGSTSGGTASFDVGIDITGTQKNLYAGATATVSITVAQRADVLTVPTAAITTSNGQTVVTKLVAGKKTSTEITIGESFGAVTEVTKGLAEGDQVVISFANRAGAGTGTRTGQGTGTRTGQGAGAGQGRTGNGGGFGGGAVPEGNGQQPAAQASGGTR